MKRVKIIWKNFESTRSQFSAIASLRHWRHLYPDRVVSSRLRGSDQPHRRRQQGKRRQKCEFGGIF